MAKNVKEVIENTEVIATDIPMETEVEGSAALAVAVIVAGVSAIVAAGVGVYKLVKHHKAKKEMDEQPENGDAEENE